MGKGTKHAADWKETTLQVVLAAKRLYTHSVKIMGNEKVFKPSNDFHCATLNRIHELLLDVYLKTFEANRVNVSRNPELANERLALQRFAIVDCQNLLALFELAKSQFHLDARKFWNWMEMLVNLGKKLSAWHKSDVERYGTMSHETTNAMFDSCVDSWTAKRVKETLDKQYKGEFGYNPGSQMVQIAGIAYLNGLDHFIKEKLRTKLYVRYMDDFHLIGETERELSDKRDSISEELAKVGMELHPDKTVLRKATAGIGFLGYTFKVAKGGKVLMFRDRKRVKEIRRRMIRLTNKIRRDECARTALRDSYQCVRSCMEHGNSNRLLRRMDSFYRSLERSIQNG